MISPSLGSTSHSPAYSRQRHVRRTTHASHIHFLLHIPPSFLTMSAATRLTTVAGVLTTSAAILGVSAHPSVRDFISRHLGENGSRNIWRFLAVLFALLNLKNLPGFWHIRVLRGILYQLYLQPTTQKPKHLFAPMITSSWNTIVCYLLDPSICPSHLLGRKSTLTNDHPPSQPSGTTTTTSTNPTQLTSPTSTSPAPTSWAA